jgi:hypothetical protein
MVAGDTPGPSGTVQDKYLDDISADELSADAPVDETDANRDARRERNRKRNERHSGHITRYPLPEPELPGTEPKLPEPVLPDANSGSESNYPKFYWVIRVVRPGTQTTRST